MENWASVQSSEASSVDFPDVQESASLRRIGENVQVESSMKSRICRSLRRIDGLGAYDTISRGAMLRGLMRVLGAALPFTRMFYGRPSVEMDSGEVHRIPQGEGSEQGARLPTINSPKVNDSSRSWMAHSLSLPPHVEVDPAVTHKMH